MYPAILVQMAEAIEKSHIDLSGGGRDGRLNSAQLEDKVVKFLQAEFDGVDEGVSRHWWDIAVTDSSKNWYPVNIKITSLRGNDNISSKEGLFYALTGIDLDHEKISINSWKNFFANLKKYLSNDATKDYYFIVCDKDPHAEKKAWVASLKTLNTLVPNGNNLPFQCKWADNKEGMHRSPGEAQKFLLGYLAKSIELRAQILDEFNFYFPDVPRR